MPFSSLDDVLQNKFAEYREEYAKAESALKAHEVLAHEGLVAAALNEFRYAGQHMARALTASTVEDAANGMSDAVRHLRRATYDAYDGALSYYMKQCVVFQEDYKSIPVASVITDYVADLQKLDAVNAELAAEDRGKKETYIHTKERQFDTAKGTFQKWHISRNELNKILLKERGRLLWALIGTGIGLAGLIVALIK